MTTDNNNKQKLPRNCNFTSSYMHQLSNLHNIIIIT